MCSREFFHEANGRRILTCLAGLLVVGMAMSSSAAKADPGETIPIDDVAHVGWTGPEAPSKLGDQLINAGDVNGDGRDDLAASVAGSGPNHPYRGIWMLFGGHNGSLADLDPSDGYMIRLTSSNFSPNDVFSIGDQNDDGTPDTLLRAASETYVIYGVKDPAATLPECDPVGAPVTRCLDVPALLDVNGDRLGYRISSGLTSDNFGWAAAGGDFDGDGANEVIYGARGTDVVDNNRGAVWVVQSGLDSMCPATPTACQIDLNTVAAPEVIRIDGPFSGAQFGYSAIATGDLNGDGKDDLAVASEPGTNPAGNYVIYGKDWTTSPVSVESFGASDGFLQQFPFGVLNATAFMAGDANGDGLNDLSLLGYAGVPPVGALTVGYTPSEAPAAPIPLDPLGTDAGYKIEAAAGENLAGSSFGTPGDMNRDGYDEQMIGSPGFAIDGNAGAGAVSIVLGQGPSPTGSVTLDDAMPITSGFSIVGNASTTGVGSGIAALGDLDGTGQPVFAVAAPGAKGGAGEIYLVRSAEIFGNGVTGQAASVSEDSAELGGFANPNGRASNAYFEYGTADSYGSTTADTDIGGSHKGQAVSSSLTGLSADTTYHYRLVVENDLGLKSYGQDRTFKTGAKPVNPCADPNAAGCSNGPGTGKEFCELHPADEICKPDVTEPGLSDLIANVRSAKVRRGKKAVVWAWITSTGTANADGVKVCANVPKRKAKIAGKRCRTIGSLAPGKTAKVKFKIKAKARKGAKVKVKLVASGQGVSNKRPAKVRFTVR